MTEAEKEVLRQAAAHAGLPRSEADRYVDHIETRLRKGAEEYGELAYLERSFSECEAEAIEEQHDAGGWSSLALRLLDRDVLHGFPADIAELIRLQVLKGVAEAQQSAKSFEGAIDLYREHAHLVKDAPEIPSPPVSCTHPISGD